MFWTRSGHVLDTVGRQANTPFCDTESAWVSRDAHFHFSYHVEYFSDIPTGHMKNIIASELWFIVPVGPTALELSWVK